jgi:hypothetical protein
MEFPVRAEDVKIVQGASGKGLQVFCACGCVNWNHVEVQTSTWVCRNCGRTISHYFPGLVEGALLIQKREPEPEAAPSKS